MVQGGGVCSMQQLKGVQGYLLGNGLTVALNFYKPQGHFQAVLVGANTPPNKGIPCIIRDPSMIPDTRKNSIPHET